MAAGDRIGIALEATSQEILDKFDDIGIGDTFDDPGGAEGGSVMAKLNYLLAQFNPGSQTFTTNGVFVVPDAITDIYITACGGGGGGGNSYAEYSAGGGGGGAACIVGVRYKVASGQEIPITIGQGGASATAGTATVIGDLVTVAGGGAGKSGTRSTNGNGSGGAAGGAGGGKGGAGMSGYQVYANSGEDGIVGKGGKGGYCQTDFETVLTPAGGGGGGSYGNGGAGGSGSRSSGGGTAGSAGGYGAGGGGGGTSKVNGTSKAGGKGGNGIVIISWGVSL